MLNTNQIDDVIIISPVDHVNFVFLLYTCTPAAQSSSNVPIILSLLGLRLETS